ncbi:MAG TPA: GNAT family N-acetyltransferase [Polyangiaceae bacterium]
MEPFALRTERLTLRHLAPGDAEVMFALNADPEVMRYLPDGPFPSVEEARRFLEGYQEVYRTEGFARWAVVEDATGEVAGWCGLRRLQDGDVDVGYRLLRSAWGRGIATEAGRASLVYGFRTLGLDRIVARADVGNAGSLRVLAKIGLRFERNEMAGGHECALWTLSREQWEGGEGAP